MPLHSALKILTMSGALALESLSPAAAHQAGCALPDATETQSVADVQAVGNALEEWKLAWGRDRARSQFAGLTHLYVGGDAIRTLALANDFKGWQITWMAIDRITVTGDEAASTTTILRSGDGGHRVVHVWRKVDGHWQILHEQFVSPTQDPQRASN